ncbi:hypothetical protein SEPCBS119000_006741 [Sporothrix epigloea]|uniref:Retrotransposon gag domain-containing protein n=1 Tax=Sporothrix epigloea TaxID=1892477 RepID=A0ABP0E7X4_9PEZI
MSNIEHHPRETSPSSSLSPSLASQQAAATWTAPDFDEVMSGAKIFHAPTHSGPAVEWAAQLYRLATDTLSDIQELVTAIRGQPQAIDANRYGRLRTAYCQLADTIRGLLPDTTLAADAATRRATLWSCDQFAHPLWTEVARTTLDTDQRYRAIERLSSLAERRIVRQEDTHRPPPPTPTPPRQDDSEHARQLRAFEEAMKAAAAVFLSGQQTSPAPRTPSAQYAPVERSVTPSRHSGRPNKATSLMNKPSTYDGQDKELFRPWWQSINDFLRVLGNAFETDSAKISWVGSLMTGRAAMWHHQRVPNEEKGPQESWQSYSSAIKERFRDPSEARKNMRKIRDLQYEGDIYSYLTEFNHLNAEVHFSGIAFQEHLLEILPKGISDLVYTRQGGVPNDDEDFVEAVTEAGLAYENKTASRSTRPAKLPDARRGPIKPEPPKSSAPNDSRTFPRLRPVDSVKPNLWPSPNAALKDVEQTDVDRHRQAGASCIRCGRNNHSILDCFSIKSVTGKTLPFPPKVAGVKRALSDADEVPTLDSKKARIDAVSAGPSNFFAYDDDEDNFEQEEDFS